MNFTHLVLLGVLEFLPDRVDLEDREDLKVHVHEHFLTRRGEAAPSVVCDRTLDCCGVQHEDLLQYTIKLTTGFVLEYLLFYPWVTVFITVRITETFGLPKTEFIL